MNQIFLTPLSTLECRKGDVKLPNTTIISLYGRYSYMILVDEDDFTELLAKFVEWLNHEFKRNKTVEFDTWHDCFQLSLPSEVHETA
jgi:hypothetical protein